MKTFWKGLGLVILGGLVVDKLVNTIDKVRQNRLEDELYKEELQRKREEREAKKKAKEEKKAQKNADKNPTEPVN